jgi:hypothetical protein
VPAIPKRQGNRPVGPTAILEHVPLYRERDLHGRLGQQVHRRDVGDLARSGRRRGSTGVRRSLGALGLRLSTPCRFLDLFKALERFS